MEKVKKANKNKKPDLRDGIRFAEGDGWVHVRMSGTEPILRIIAEAPTEEKARALADTIKEQGVK